MNLAILKNSIVTSNGLNIKSITILINIINVIDDHIISETI